jgi:hypothetical protein
MKNLTASLILLIVAVIILGTSGCTTADTTTPPTTPPPPTTVQQKSISGNGTVVALVGGTYGIYGDDGKQYLPVTLADEFKTDGLRIAYTGALGDFEKEMGTPITLTAVKKLPEEISNVTGEDFFRGFRDIPPPHIKQFDEGITTTNTTIGPPLTPPKNNT